MTGGARNRRAAFRLGLAAEYVAAFYLMAKGYRLLALRQRTPLGEIDLIMRRRDLVVFVEVKARRSLAEAVDAVGPAAQARIRNASVLWLGRRPDVAGLSWRHDIVAIRPWRLPAHLADAF